MNNELLKEIDNIADSFIVCCDDDKTKLIINEFTYTIKNYLEKVIV